jgi:glycosyltransferase involved in cell wall biosynthesis
MFSTSNSPLILHTDWSRSWGGQEIRTLTELREMRKLGFRCCLMVPENSELARRGQGEGLEVWPVEFTSKFHLASWKRIIQGIRQLRPAVVNTHSSEDTWMAGAAARLLGVPLVIRTRHVLAPVSSAFSYNVFPHVILACSEAIRDGLAEQGVPADKIVVQPTGIDEERFQFSPEKRERIRKQYGIGDDDILVGNVGFLRVYKGQEFIVRTAATMLKHFTFMLVGGGNDRPQLEEQVQQLGVRDRFIFAGHQENPEEYFSAFDILFFSSWSVEGIAQSYIQGLLYGLPLLVCRTPSIMEPLPHVQTYQLIDYDDLEAARDGLMQLSRHLDRDERKIELQRGAIAAQYGLKAMIDNLLRIYSQHGIEAPR